MLRYIFFVGLAAILFVSKAISAPSDYSKTWARTVCGVTTGAAPTNSQQKCINSKLSKLGQEAEGGWIIIKDIDEFAEAVNRIELYDHDEPRFRFIIEPNGAIGIIVRYNKMNGITAEYLTKISSGQKTDLPVEIKIDSNKPTTYKAITRFDQCEDSMMMKCKAYITTNSVVKQIIQDFDKANDVQIRVGKKSILDFDLTNFDRKLTEFLKYADDSYSKNRKFAK